LIGSSNGFLKAIVVGEIAGSHGGAYECDCLLGCCAVQSSSILPTFHLSTGVSPNHQNSINFPSKAKIITLVVNKSTKY
jgi:hypothetical protein